jgi:nucleotide-binding universal stress UspA family protein
MRDLHRVLVPVDFSPSSDAALGEALDIAWPYGAAIHLLHVWKPRLLAMGLDAAPSLEAFAATGAGEKMKAYLQQVEGFGLEVRGRLEEGDPEEVILRLGHEYDLIVMGTHARMGVGPFFRGTIAAHVVRRASCPVLTVHARTPRATADEEAGADAR